MRKTKIMTDELTTKMHSEFEVDEDTNRKHVTWTALEVIADGTMTKKRAMKEYSATEEDFSKYSKEFNDLFYE